MIGRKKSKKEKIPRVWKWTDTLTVWILTIILIGNAVMLIFLSVMLLTVLDECEYSEFQLLPKDLEVDRDITTNISLCNNLSLMDTSECLSAGFQSMFTYQATTDYEYSNFTEVDNYIRGYGGDCHEAATWFDEAGGELGYFTEYVSFVTSVNDTGDILYRQLHAFTVISDNTGYCILDQGQIVRCFNFLVNNSVEATDNDDFFSFVIS